MGKMIEKMVQIKNLGKNQSKLIKSVTSCSGHLAQVDLSWTLGLGPMLV